PAGPRLSDHGRGRRPRHPWHPLPLGSHSHALCLRLTPVGRGQAGATPAAKIALVRGCMSMLRLRQAPQGRPAPHRGDWQSPTPLPRPLLTVAFAGSAAFAVALAMVTVWQAHRLWGIFA